VTHICHFSLSVVFVDAESDSYLGGLMWDEVLIVSMQNELLETVNVSLFDDRCSWTLTALQTVLFRLSPITTC
jgi:hypothetical protein